MQTTDKPHAANISGRRTRDPWLDNIRLVAIVLVVVGHAIGTSKGINQAAGTLSTFLYLFHIPMFALAAGWTAQRLTASLGTLGKMTWQVLVPYAIFQTIAIMLGRWDGREPPLQFATPTFALWFLLSLFTWRLLTPWFRGSAYGLVAAVAVTLCAGMVPEVGEPFSLSRTLFFFPAFLVGATYGDRLSGWLDRRSIRIVGATMLLAALFYCSFFADSMNRKLQLGRDSYEALGMGALDGAWARLLTVAIGIGLALACIAIVPRRRLPLTRLGAYTLYVYLLHVVIRRVLVALDLFPRATDFPELIALVAGAIVVALLLASTPVRLLTRPLVEPLWVRNLLRRTS
jgi:fucose 4-O-acetylase-like acetyltransferase